MLQVYIDKELSESGTLFDDFDMLAPKTIKVRFQHYEMGAPASLVHQAQ
jgi:hypothetical protein